MTLTLVTIDSAGHRLEAIAAASYARMLAAGCPAGVTSAYRTEAEQAALRAAYLAHPTTVAYAASVAVSGHPKGTRLDLPEPARTWARQHGSEYGWWWGENPSEPWHFAYDLTRDRHLVTGAPTPLQEDDMTPAESEALNEIRGNAQNILNGILGLIATVGDNVGSGQLHDVRAGVDIANAKLDNISNGIWGLLGRTPGAVAALTDADLQRIAKAVADEQSKRMAQ